MASQRSTVASQYLQDEHAEADIKLYDTQDNAYLDLTSGRVRAMMSDKVTGIDWLKQKLAKTMKLKVKRSVLTKTRWVLLSVKAIL